MDTPRAVSATGSCISQQGLGGNRDQEVAGPYDIGNHSNRDWCFGASPVWVGNMSTHLSRIQRGAEDVMGSIERNDEGRRSSLLSDGPFRCQHAPLYGEGGDKAFVRLQREIMKQSIDDSIFAWSMKKPPSHPLVRSLTYEDEDQYHYNFVAWRPELFYSGDEIFTAWSGDISATTVEGSGWTAATISHQSTAYGETQRYLSLTAPILTAANLSDVSEVKLFMSSGEYRPKEPGVQYHQLTGTDVTSIFEHSRVIAILSCRYSVGRVGIVLQKHSDGTYSRLNDWPVSAVQVRKLPPVETINIRHQQGLGLECSPGPSTFEAALTEIDVIVVDGRGYYCAGTHIPENEFFWRWVATSRGMRFSSEAHIQEGFAALLYCREDGSLAISPTKFALGIKWSGETVECTVVTIRENGGAEKEWAGNVDWKSQLWEPGSKKFYLESSDGCGAVVVKVRKAPHPYIGGLGFYVFLAVQ